MINSLAAVGGQVGRSGYTLGQRAGRNDGRWHQVAIAVYPSVAAMMTMLAVAKYRAAAARWTWASIQHDVSVGSN